MFNLRRGSLLALCLLPLSAASFAQSVQITASGVVTSVQADKPGSISLSDPVVLSFLFDPALVGTPTVLSLGGGTSTIYDTLLTDLSLQVGIYSFAAASVPASLYYQDDFFGQDGFGFAFHDGIAGPFSSTFANIQLQFRAPSTDVLNGSGISNGLPLSGTNADVFAVFGGGSNANVRATNVAVSIAPVSGVPEPETWAMVLLGFGAVGGAIRYRRRKPAVSFAIS